MNHIYQGARRSNTHWPCVVTKDGKVLSPKPGQRLINHSPDGFNWGYGGSGPAQLALALLLDVTGDKEIALRHYQQFKWDYVANWGKRWEISSEEILSWINAQSASVGE